jgi:hypothetical protein
VKPDPDLKHLPVWKWNEDVDKPTVTPSIRVRGGSKEGETTCHFFITDGEIRYLGDCTHELKGQTVPMLEWPEWNANAEESPTDSSAPT